jgi:hypothetical protein
VSDVRSILDVFLHERINYVKKQIAAGLPLDSKVRRYFELTLAWSMEPSVATEFSDEQICIQVLRHFELRSITNRLSA